MEHDRVISYFFFTLSAYVRAKVERRAQSAVIAI
jgi:hypothetical protein